MSPAKTDVALLNNRLIIKWFNLLKYLNEKQISWIFEVSREKKIKAGSVLIEKNTDIQYIYFIIKGLLHVQAFDTLKKVKFPKILGPGEILGEISFLDEGKTIATIVAAEDSYLLELPKTILEEKLAKDGLFAANFYKSLAYITANRLRQTMQELTFAHNSQEIYAELHHEKQFNEAFSALQSFKEAIAKISSLTAKNREIPTNLIQLAESKFIALTNLLDSTLKARLSEDIKNKLGKQIQIEMLPFILLTESALCAYSKPRGYAGDFHILDLIYKNKGGGLGVIGPIIDQFFLNSQICSAVRNRRDFLKKEILSLLKEKKSINVACFACGPAEEIFDVYETLKDKAKLKATLVDFDIQALAFVGAKCEKLKLSKQMTLLHENLLYLALGRKKLELKKFDLIYSLGLIDYFEDEIVIKLINYIYDYLTEGGKVILGNLHKNSPNKAAMQYLLEWNLIYRNEEDMNRLFKLSKFDKACDQILFEKNHINMLAECIKT